MAKKVLKSVGIVFGGFVVVVLVYVSPEPSHLRELQ